MALGKGSPISTKTDFAEALMASDICLNMSEFYAKISYSSAFRLRAEKLNKCCFLLPEALLHFIKPFRDNF